MKTWRDGKPAKTPVAARCRAAQSGCDGGKALDCYLLGSRIAVQPIRDGWQHHQ